VEGGIDKVVKKVYTMKNREDKVAIECTEEYVLRWTALGFVVVSTRNEPDNYELQHVPYTEDSEDN